MSALSFISQVTTSHPEVTSEIEGLVTFIISLLGLVILWQFRKVIWIALLTILGFIYFFILEIVRYFPSGHHPPKSSSLLALGIMLLLVLLGTWLFYARSPENP